MHPVKSSLNGSKIGLRIYNQRQDLHSYDLNLAIAYAQAYHDPPISATTKSTEPEPQYP